MLPQSTIDILRKNNITFQEAAAEKSQKVYDFLGSELTDFWEVVIDSVVGLPELRPYIKAAGTSMSINDKMKVKSIILNYFKQRDFMPKMIDKQDKVLKQISEDKRVLYDLYIKKRIEAYKTAFNVGVDMAWDYKKDELKELDKLTDQFGFDGLLKIDSIFQDIYKRGFAYFLVCVERCIGMIELKDLVKPQIRGLIAKGTKDFYTFIANYYLSVGTLANKHLSIIGVSTNNA